MDELYQLAQIRQRDLTREADRCRLAKVCRILNLITATERELPALRLQLARA